MGADYLALDRAYWHPAIFDAAQAVGASAIRGYVFDHYLEDQGGFCGGWTPAVIAEIYSRGYDFGPIFVFRDGEAPPDPSRCVEILQQLGVRAGAWAHDDIEGGATDRVEHAVALSAALRGASYHPAPYGTPSTLNAGYLSGAEGAWVAYYLSNPDWRNQPALASVPWVGSWDFIGWQYANSNSIAGVDVDVSVMNFPIGGKGAAPVRSTPVPVAPFDITTKDGHWFDGPNGHQVGAFTAGQTWHVVEVVRDPGNGWDWYRPDLGAAGHSWWLVGSTPAGDADATIVAAGPQQPPTTPATLVDLTPVLVKLDDLKLQVAGIPDLSAKVDTLTGLVNGISAKVTKDLA